MLHRDEPQRHPSFADLYTAGVSPEAPERMAIARARDFGFVDEALAASYAEEGGRPASPPQVLFKMLVLETYAGLSDREVAIAPSSASRWTSRCRLTPRGCASGRGSGRRASSRWGRPVASGWPRPGCWAGRAACGMLPTRWPTSRCPQRRGSSARAGPMCFAGRSRWRPRRPRG